MTCLRVAWRSLRRLVFGWPPSDGGAGPMLDDALDERRPR